MQFTVTETKNEPLLSRTMIKANLEFDSSTPPYKEVASMIASSLKKDEKLIAIRHIYNSFGCKKAEVIAYVYGDEARKHLIEPKVKENNKKITTAKQL